MRPEVAPPTIDPVAFEALAAPATGPCVSFYLPTHKAGGVGVRQDRPRLKNLLREAETELATLGHPADVLSPAMALLQDGHEIWQHRGDGLAVFAGPGAFRWYALPSAVAEQAVVADRFHLKPLIGALGDDVSFYLLSLSPKRVRVARASRHHVVEIAVPDLPRTIEDAVGTDRDDRQLQFHSGPGSGPAGDRASSSIAHGQGAVGDDDVRRRELRRFLEAVDRALAPIVARRPAPIVLAAVDDVAAMWRDLSGVSRFHAGTVSGSPDRAALEALRDEAYPIVVERRIRPSRRSAAERYRELAAKDRATAALDRVVTAAADGRVDTLFVAADECRWGRFDPRSRALEVHPARRAGDEDLLDRAAVGCVLGGGTLFVVPRAEMPIDAPLCAILRY